MADSIASSIGDLTIGSDGPEEILQGHVERGTALLDEIERYISAVIASQEDVRISNGVNYRALRNDLRHEMDSLMASLSKIQDARLSQAQARNIASSTNLTYFEALWAVAKRSSGLINFRKYFSWDRGKQNALPKRKRVSNNSPQKEKNSALVDIIACNGAEWIRISTATEKRLLFDLAKLGWENSDDDDSDGNSHEDKNLDNRDNGDDDDDEQVALVKNARELIRAAKANPIIGRPPTVRIVLTRIQSGKVKEIDVVLDKIRATGAVVQCMNDIFLEETPSLESVLPKLLPDQSHTLSETLNIDCTILLALISDISHKECPVLDFYPHEVKSQIAEEKEKKLLPTSIYPLIGSHPMVCTQDAADQMNLIVDTLATDTEKRRANILLGQKDRKNVPSDKLRNEWQDMSNHPIPENFQLPLKVVPCNIDETIAKLPPVAKQIASELTPLNISIFFYGWASRLTTLSANRTRARQIEKIIDEVGLSDGEVGPHIWTCGESRSLIAKSGRPSREPKKRSGPGD
ncbi:hypothetical protein DM02DRAFT_80516 [Periconia macrospinosa]|uniref:DUF1308 domain-containing protein n=1 Tax=Periconia macrospinosa TaxID=97972 RepID=A0A2V1DHJ6_9PLEO|nr:hypothetical protein DM02DRAFT_80516 [Periconia macrospinosa]